MHIFSNAIHKLVDTSHTLLYHMLKHTNITFSCKYIDFNKNTTGAETAKLISKSHHMCSMVDFIIGLRPITLYLFTVFL